MRFPRKGVFLFHRGPVGVIAELTDSVGAVMAQYVYEPFGAPLPSTAPNVAAPVNPVGFVGEYTDGSGMCICGRGSTRRRLVGSVGLVRFLSRCLVLRCRRIFMRIISVGC